MVVLEGIFQLIIEGRTEDMNPIAMFFPKELIIQIPEYVRRWNEGPGEGMTLHLYNVHYLNGHVPLVPYTLPLHIYVPTHSQVCFIWVSSTVYLKKLPWD